MHIPKTAGTSVSMLLAQSFEPDEVFHFRSNEHAGAPRFSPHYGDEQPFVQLPREQRATFRCLLGHVRFGIHTAVPRPARYFTMLRDPLERYLSQVAQYNRMAEGGELGPTAVPVPLAEFRGVKPHQFSNPQARWIAGLTPEAAMSLTPELLLDAALQRLADHFADVGVVERMGLSANALARLVGKPLPRFDAANASPRRPSATDMSESERVEFAEANRVDAQLWAWAVERLDAQKSRDARWRNSLGGFGERAVRRWLGPVRGWARRVTNL